MTRFLEEFEKHLEATVSSDMSLYLGFCSVYSAPTFAPQFSVITLLFESSFMLLPHDFHFQVVSASRAFLGTKSDLNATHLGLIICPFFLPSSENEGPSAFAEHRMCSQGEVEADHAAEGVPGVAAALQRAGRQRERIRHLRGVGGGRKQSCRGGTQTWRPGERSIRALQSKPAQDVLLMRY